MGYFKFAIALYFSYDIVEFVRPLVVFENAVWFSEDKLAR